MLNVFNKDTGEVKATIEVEKDAEGHLKVIVTDIKNPQRKMITSHFLEETSHTVILEGDSNE